MGKSKYYLIAKKKNSSDYKIINLEDNESMYYFQKCLDELGVNKALKEAGVKEGDTVKVVDWELEWMD